jgi:two-component system cell cycle sensor histidine kinase/response regulator CckA
MMPRMGGKVMAEWLKTKYSGLKILYVSGYADDVFASNANFDSSTAFLPKPYTTSKLAARVRELLDETAVSMPQMTEKAGDESAVSSHSRVNPRGMTE